MNTMSAYMMGQMNRGKEQKVFDWDQAARIIKERKADYAVAGLQSDLEYTAGVILDGGKPIDSDYTYLASTWAIPVLVFYHDNDVEEVPCYIMAHETEWGAHTKWPLSALAILNA